MNDGANHDPLSDGCNDPEQTEEERIFFQRILRRAAGSCRLKPNHYIHIVDGSLCQLILPL
jgi:hypothetical protein